MQMKVNLKDSTLCLFLFLFLFLPSLFRVCLCDHVCDHVYVHVCDHVCGCVRVRGDVRCRGRVCRGRGARETRAAKANAE